MHLSTLLLPALALPALSTALPPACQTLSIPLSATANNKLLPPTLSLAAALAPTFNVSALPSTPVSGTYTLSARYCPPTTSVPSRRSTLQVLVHGATYTKDYWSGLAPPGPPGGQENYSWTSYASAQGYASLSIDRLCNGASDRPNGLLVCQLPLQVELIHQLIQLARAGGLALPGVETGKRWEKVMIACHSYGSLVCHALAGAHPADTDAVVLTGFSGVLVNGLSGIGTRPVFVPASLAAPERFASLALDPTYLAATSIDGAEFIFYFGQFDRGVLEYDFANRGTVTVGEIATALLGQLAAPGYTGKVFVLNGREDSIFCQSTALNPVLGVRGNCDQGFSEGVRALYPSAGAFGVFNAKETGHCLNTHLTAKDSFKDAHDFLRSVGL